MRRRGFISVVVSLALLFNSGAGMAVMNAPQADAGEIHASGHCAEMASADSTASDCCADGHCVCMVHALVAAPPVAVVPQVSCGSQPASPAGNSGASRPDDPLRPPIY